MKKKVSKSRCRNFLAIMTDIIQFNSLILKFQAVKFQTDDFHSRFHENNLELSECVS